MSTESQLDSRSPYANAPVDRWGSVTQALIQAHPLSLELIHDAALASWQRLWSSRVGDGRTGFDLVELEPPATVVGYFFEKIFSKELANRLPGMWIGGTGSQKDLHCINDETKSVEMKSSGQLGYRVYGNRSYGQTVEAGTGKKDKSGYYITINFYRTTLTLLRFGWIDADDWQAQRAATGQMAGLGQHVYDHKLVTIRGAYMLDGPVGLLPGVGPKAAQELALRRIYTIRDLIMAEEAPLSPSQKRAQQVALSNYSDLL